MKRYYVIRVNYDNKDTYASPYSVRAAIELSGYNVRDNIEWAIVYASDAGAARLKKPRAWGAVVACAHCSSLGGPHDTQEWVGGCGEAVCKRCHTTMVNETV